MAKLVEFYTSAATFIQWPRSGSARVNLSSTGRRGGRITRLKTCRGDLRVISIPKGRPAILSKTRLGHADLLDTFRRHVRPPRRAHPMCSVKPTEYGFGLA